MKPGDRVVCVDVEGLVKGNVYTIEAVDSYEPSIRIEATWFHSSRFHPYAGPAPTIIFRTVKQASADNGQTWVDVP